ncbi:MAG: sialate O-acetylesterase [Planctomycetes bacterium]|nr:sialate O-acetylesterase [Planctomycetota bacterium]
MTKFQLSRWIGSAVLGAAALVATDAWADVKLPNIFSDSMVLQQGQENKVWGKDNPGQSITLTIGDQKITATADAAGNWQAKLPAMEVGGPYTLTVAGSSSKTINDILVGEVWICSGQSNMQWSVNQSNDPDLEKLAARFPKIRMINFPQVGTQDSIWSHDDRKWQICSPETVGGFSAVGYFFARQIHETTGVPIGMINNAWGGSACEAWINRDVLKSDGKFNKLLEGWAGRETQFEELTKKQGRTEAEEKTLKDMTGGMRGNSRPANIYNGVLKSHLGYGIRGAIWYQGESNAGRAYQYRELFPLMIQNWRNEWGQGDFPFYWVQLADFMGEVKEPAESDWAELREAQTMAMDKLPNSGQAVIIDIGEGKDIHPKNKVDVGRRLARWALAKQYNIPIEYQSPRYSTMEVDGDGIVLSFKHLAGGWRPFDVNEPVGFAIAGDDKKFYNAQAKITDGGKVRVSSPNVAKPVAVRYAWANNPVCNMYGAASGLPLTPFRTDDWPGVTAGRE